MTSILSILTLFRVIVLPVNFQDCAIASDSVAVASMLDDAGTYFREELGDTLSFELAPPVTLPKQTSYYGRNISDTHDERIHEAVIRAVRDVQQEVDFSLYDNDSDGKVECVVLFTAGLSEADGTSADNVWPQQDRLSNHSGAITASGKQIDSYIVVPELWSDYGQNARLTGIGTLCHEFCHILGLVDYYDTDGIAGGGISPAMWGSTALMDTGDHNDEGRTPPHLNAVDRWLLGLGECSELTEGHHTLHPMGREDAGYLIFNTENEGEFFLFEARSSTGRDAFIGGSGLLVYHIDRSEPTYLPKWNENKVNCSPEHQCAYIIPANPDAGEVSDIFFPCGTFRNFTSDSQSEFRYWDGNPAPLALLDITGEIDGSVSFDVIKPFSSVSVASYQDAATVSWELHESVSDSDVSLILSSSGSPVDTVSAGTASFISLENLEPGSAYTVELVADGPGLKDFSTKTQFRTKAFVDGSRPFILLSGAERNEDGSFISGTSIPLRVYNLKNVSAVSWTFNGSPARCGSDGLFRITGSGLLKAEALLDDGSTTILTKEITVK